MGSVAVWRQWQCGDSGSCGIHRLFYSAGLKIVKELVKAFRNDLVWYYGGPEVTFSHSDFYKVNEIVFKPLLFDFSKVERVLCSSLSCLTLVKSNG